MRIIGYLCLPLVLLSGCKIDLTDKEQTANFQYAFAQGALGWQAGFADYPQENSGNYELGSGIKTLPSGFTGSGFMLSGHNRSDDLFMYLKRRITGLSPSSRYQASLKVSFLSHSGAGCVGIGGAPGEAVYLHFGYADIEPKQSGYTLNVPKGNQSQDGAQSKVLGDIAVAGLPCDASKYQSKMLSSTATKNLTLTTDASGAVWIFVGTDSGFEGKTTLYYQNIELNFTPAS